jgi:hypothetical protein
MTNQSASVSPHALGSNYKDRLIEITARSGTTRARSRFVAVRDHRGAIHEQAPYMLKSSADDPGNHHRFGHGMVDAASALH